MSSVKQTHPDWLLQILIDRCKDGSIVDMEDLALILNLNLERETPIEIRFFGADYGEFILELGKVVVANGGVLTVPNLEDYDQTEDLTAPPDWLERWSNDDTVPDRHELWAWFDVYSAQRPDGNPYVIDGPGSHTLENWEAYNNKRNRILRERRERRDSTRSGKA